MTAGCRFELSPWPNDFAGVSYRITHNADFDTTLRDDIAQSSDCRSKVLAVRFRLVVSRPKGTS